MLDGNCSRKACDSLMQETGNIATTRKLMSLPGKATKSAALRGLIVSDKLQVSKEEDFHEGLPVTEYFSGKKAGYEILAEGGRVNTVLLYVEKADGFAALPGPLPYKIPGEADRIEVRRLLGKPEKSGKAFKHKIPGPKRAWDRFAVESIFIHIEYSDAELKVSLITLMTEEAAP
jgi:hypothetical protein